eukprot:scaffold22260_cov78-Skeletonema_dohrnii-CCMP3373.AAC.1
MQASNVPYSKSEDSGDVSSMASDGCGSFGSSVGMSTHRQYNTAMAKRMRQRRMRRMKKRDATPSSTFSERVKAAKGDDEQYKQQKSSSVPANPTAAGLHPISSVPNPPPPPPKILKKRIPN